MTGCMSQTHASSPGKNTCREVKVWHRVYSYVRYSKVLDSDVQVEANKDEGAYKMGNYQIPLIRIVGTPGLKMLASDLMSPASISRELLEKSVLIWKM